MRHEDAERGNGDARERQHARDPGQHDNAGDDGCGRQHDRDLKRRRRKLEVMIFCGGEVALLFRLPGALRELLGALAGFRLGAVARRGLLPVVDLLLDRKSVV